MSNSTRTMKISLLAAALLSVGSALAYGDGYGYGTTDELPKLIKTASSGDPALPAAVKISGDVLTDKNGMTLYIFDKDAAGSGKSACNAACAAKWPALAASDTAKETGAFSVVARDDGRKQWAYKGRPLYLWAGDGKPGDATGDGVGGVWHKAAQ